MSKYEELLRAIKDADVDAVRALTADGFDDWGDDDGARALSDASRCRAHESELIELLFAAGLSVDKHVDSLCVLLSKDVSADLISRILKAGADPNMETFGGRPLQYAARQGRADLVELLLQHGANPELGSLIRTPLVDAVDKNHTQVAVLLLRAGAKLPDPETMPAVANAVSEAAYRGDAEMIDALLDSGVDIDTRGDISRYDAKEKGTLRHVGDWIRQKSRQPTTYLFYNAPLLHIAAGQGHLPLVQLLVQRGANLSLADADGHTALQVANRAGHSDVASYLKDHGGHCEPALSQQQRLLLAVQENDMPQVKQLLSEGVDPNVQDQRAPTCGFRPLMFAATYEHVELIDVLVQAGADVNATDVIDGQEKHRNLSMLYSMGGADAINNIPLNRSVLMFAIDRKQYESVQRLLAHGAEINHQDWVKETPLSLALAGREAIALQLIEAGADLSVRDSDKATPLVQAIEHRAWKAADAIIERGCKVDLKDCDGNTALMLAVEAKKAETVEKLIAAGANPMLVNQEKKSALQLAKRNKKLTEILRRSPKVSGTAAKKKTAKKKASKQPKPSREKNQPAWSVDKSIDVSQYDPQAVHRRLQLAVESPSFAAATQRLEELAGTKSVPVPSQKPIGRMVHLDRHHKTSTEEYQSQLHPMGVFAFDSSGSGEEKSLVILPSEDPYDAPVAMGTNGVNCGVMTEDIIRFFKQLESEYALHFTGFRHDIVQGRFDGKIDRPAQLAKRFYAFCPDIVDQGVGDVSELTKILRRKNPEFFFWWD